jgi:mannose-6-phosphate isomerase
MTNTTGAITDRREDVVVDERTWGVFRQYSHNEASTVKIITVRPDEALSLQRHRHRDELWVVLDDGLLVEIESVTVRAVAGQEFFVRRGEVHRVSGGASGGRFLEVAFGHFDEADIERLEDRYDR